MNKSEIGNLTVAQLVNRYEITAQGDKIQISKYAVKRSGDRAENVLSVCAARKPEILSHFAEIEARKRDAAKEQERKIAAIPGLMELDAAYDDLARWQTEFSASFEGESGGGVGVRPKPSYDLVAMNKKYPAASAYRKARHEALKENYEIAAYGREAMKMIEDDPQNYAAALEYMERENEAFVERHIWD